MASRGPEIYPYLRVVIITLRLFCTNDWRDTSSKTGVKEDTTYRIWTCTVKCTSIDTDLYEILAYISTLDWSASLMVPLNPRESGNFYLTPLIRHFKKLSKERISLTPVLLSRKSRKSTQAP
jgi:hypothetical protein